MMGNAVARIARTDPFCFIRLICKILTIPKIKLNKLATMIKPDITIHGGNAKRPISKVVVEGSDLNITTIKTMATNSAKLKPIIANLFQPTSLF